MTVMLTGANPGVLLRDAGAVTAFASVWQVDWSEHGSGPAVVLWHDGRVRLLGPDPALAQWLADTFVRHFGEVDGLPWTPGPVEQVEVELDLDLGRGLVAKAGDVTVEISDVLDRRPFAMAGLTLGGVEYALSNVYAPCRTARITVGGSAVPGAPEVEEAEPSSTAFLAVVEPWTRTD
ncbi:MAG TPA: hypothetical protein VLM05_07585 [Mycobacteriales bacterium]|nr:hypothetical protein [Mycobacteriales bacterium]